MCLTLFFLSAGAFAEKCKPGTIDPDVAGCEGKVTDAFQVDYEVKGDDLFICLKVKAENSWFATGPGTGKDHAGKVVGVWHGGHGSFTLTPTGVTRRSHIFRILPPCADADGCRCASTKKPESNKFFFALGDGKLEVNATHKVIGSYELDFSKIAENSAPFEFPKKAILIPAALLGLIAVAGIAVAGWRYWERQDEERRLNAKFPQRSQHQAANDEAAFNQVIHRVYEVRRQEDAKKAQDRRDYNRAKRKVKGNVAQPDKPVKRRKPKNEVKTISVASIIKAEEHNKLECTLAPTTKGANPVAKGKQGKHGKGKP